MTGLSIHRITRWLVSAKALMWIYPLLLIIPNLCLDITEQYSTAAKVANVCLPLGVYYLLMGISRKSGLMTLLMLPVAFFCAFQIVLLYLYGESIIAVDMFMNVATTNVSEATELLGNLSIAIITVLLLYLPPLVLAVIQLIRRREVTAHDLRRVRRCGAVVLITGVMFTAAAKMHRGEDYRVSRQLFPVNILCNLHEAVRRVGEADKYHTTSQNYSFHACNLRSDTVPEIYVLVIGETSRADNWQLFGYERPTNPRLSKRSGLLCYGHTLSESNTTHKSVPMLMSPLTAVNFGDSVAKVRSIIDAFNEAGFTTIFMSNQAENHSYIDFYTERVRVCRRICADGRNHYDSEMLPLLDSCLDSIQSRRVFIALHTYGSHYCYHERYAPEYRVFEPAEATDANPANRSQLINAYDNSIVATDALLDGIIELLDKRCCRSAMIYTSDHGEDIFDDDRGRFLHASPTPTYWQLHVPLLIWMSDEYRRDYPGKYAAAAVHRSDAVSSTASVFNTMLSLAGVATDDIHYELSLCSHAYRQPERRYLNDYNEAVSLTNSGFRYQDFDMLGRNQKKLIALE